jgi:phosphosulfolactate synthase (CoM biosynthesis protein A)
MKRLKTLIANGTASANFKSFATKFRNDLKKELPIGARLAAFSIGFYYVSGFIKLANGKFQYFSISDVRHFPDNKILVRSANNVKDFTGGHNNYVEYEEGALNKYLTRIEARDGDYTEAGKTVIWPGSIM